MSDSFHPGFRLNGPPAEGAPLPHFDPQEEALHQQRQEQVDHEDRARRRMAELRMSMGDFEMEGDSDDYRDRFAVEAPPGWSYEWKTYTVFNKEFPHYTTSLLRNGWAPVPADRHRHLLWPEYKDQAVIIDGLMLMERPRELTERRRLREIRKATDQVRVSESKLAEAPPGTGPRDAHRRTMPRLGNTVGPIGIPD